MPKKWLGMIARVNRQGAIADAGTARRVAYNPSAKRQSDFTDFTSANGMPAGAQPCQRHQVWANSRRSGGYPGDAQ
jgi:hypothetical protein